jgi:ABC-type sugar transport system substrate-binding protein
MGIGLCLGLGFSAPAQNQPAAQGSPAKERIVSGHAIGTFEVKGTPQAADAGADASIARMLLDKQIHGDLEGTSKGQMLTAGIVNGSGGYVAMERITGTLKGRSGSFVLQHSGTMTRGEPRLSVTVVPDSGTGQLEGLAGTFTIKIDAGKHSYDFEYTLPATP